MRRALVVAVAGLLVAAAPPAAAQQAAPGTLTRVLDGDSAEVAVDGVGTVRVRLLGIDAPELVPDPECGAEQAAEALAQFQGQRVTVTTDPTQPARDPAGEVYAYLDNAQGADLGRTVIGLGWAEVHLPAQPPFQRVDSYQQAETAARAARAGVWSACAGNFHRPAPKEPSQQAGPPSRTQLAEQLVRRYYGLINQRQFRRAWRLLSAGLRSRLGPYRSWRAGYGRTVGTRINDLDVTLARGKAIVLVRLRSRDRDGCSGRVVRQFFRVRWVLSPAGDVLRATDVSARKVGGGKVRSRCAPRPSPRTQRAPSRRVEPQSSCHPSYSPCVPTGRDYDCSELNGPYTVRGSDPYRLDADNDGVGCE